ncbi:unnamed protein product, partial [Urochloa humidicola]
KKKYGNARIRASDARTYPSDAFSIGATTRKNIRNYHAWGMTGALLRRWSFGARHRSELASGAARGADRRSPRPAAELPGG